MKRILLLSWLLIAILCGCEENRDDPAPEERPEARVNQALSQYKTQLTNAEHGWKAVLYPEGGAGYSFLFRFSENDRVSMTSDINATTAASPLESTYRLKALQKPSLLFDTYSYLHILADPDATKSGGDWGAGKYSDFEFTFESVSPDEIVLRGSLMGSRLVLTRATQAEAQSYIGNIAANAAAFENVSNFTTYFKRLTFGNNAFDVTVRPGVRYITFQYVEGGVAKAFTTSYYYTQNGVALLEPFTALGITISALEGVQYNAAVRQITFTANNQSGTIREATSPATVDVQGTQRFLNTSSGDYWISETGFTVNGVVDAFGVRTIPDFYFVVYWPKIGGSGRNAFDLLGIVTIDPSTNRAQIDAGPMAVPSVTSDGRIIYTYTSNYETEPKPYDDIITAMKDQWTDPQGYYVVYTSPNSVDLVSAKDAKAWITLVR